MFSKNRTAIFWGLLVLGISSQIINAGETKAFPDFRPTDNPLINLDDPKSNFREPNFLKDEEPLLRLCEPKAAQVNQNQLENEELNNSSDVSNSSSQENPDNCTPISDLNDKN